MDVLILGHDAPGSLLRSYAAGFKDAGCRVTSYCLDSRLDKIRVIRASRVTEPWLAGWYSQRLSAAVSEDLHDARPDLALVLKGQYLPAAGVRLLRETLRCAVVNFYPDDPFSKLHANRLRSGGATLREYDACFTFSKALEARFREMGVSRVTWLPFARDPYLHGPPAHVSGDRVPIAFVGDLDRKRVRWLEALSGIEIAVYGDTVRNGRALAASPIRRDIAAWPPAIGAEMSAAMASASITINLLRLQNKGSHNMRSFEALASGAFTLSEYSEEIAELFRDGTDLVTCRNPGELRAAVKEWLPQQEARQQIAASGLARVSSETYEKRARTIIGVIESAGLLGAPADNRVLVDRE